MLPDQRIGVKNGDGGAVSGENSADRYRGWAVDDRTVALRNRIYRISTNSGADGDRDFRVTGGDGI